MPSPSHMLCYVLCVMLRSVCYVVLCYVLCVLLCYVMLCYVLFCVCVSHPTLLVHPTLPANLSNASTLFGWLKVTHSATLDWQLMAPAVCVRFLHQSLLRRKDVSPSNTKRREWKTSPSYASIPSLGNLVI
jgi:hypothetical protein